MNEAQIIELHRELQYPGIEPTFLAAKKWARGNNVDPPTRAAVVAAIQKSGAKQVMAKPRAAGGHHASPGQGLFQADLVDMQYLGGSTEKGRNEGYKYIYALASVWDRKLYARKLRDKEPESVKAALGSILAAMPAEDRPKDIIHDQDGGFQGAYREFLEQRGISRRTKEKDQRQHTSVVDAAILGLKRALTVGATQSGTIKWIDRLDSVVQGLNSRPHSSLGMAAPSDIKGNAWLEYALLRKNTKYMEQNAKAWARSKRDIEPGTRFRALAARKQRGFARGYLPTYGKEVLTVQSMRENGRIVVAENGKRYATAKVLPIPEGSTDANFAPPRVRRAGAQGALPDQKSRRGGLKLRNGYYNRA